MRFLTVIVFLFSINLNANQKLETSLIFDFPIEYNPYVQKWINYFQGSGKKHFSKWLKRKKSIVPKIQHILEREGLPKDLVYMSMIESGFSSHAKSHKAAVGPWQFIKPTATRFGLTVNSWIDERKDIYKSTIAATRYLKYLYNIFGSWYLVAASYNTGENKVIAAIKKHRTKNFWSLVRKKALYEETRNYVPKIIAAMLISKAPGLYGFREIKYEDPKLYEYFHLPGGTNIESLSQFIKVNSNLIKELNPELKIHKIPKYVKSYKAKIPLHSMDKARAYLQTL